MKALKFFALIALGSLLLFSCDFFGGSEEAEEFGDWLETATEWEDEEGSHLSFVYTEGENFYIDISYNRTAGDGSTFVMGFIEEDAFTVSGNTLEGVYTSFQNADSEEEFDITIDFSYSGGVLSAVIVADGALGNKTLNLVPAD